MTEKWTGTYMYGEPYPEGIKGLSVPFVVEWENNDGILTGTSTDDETKDYFNHPATIQGFIDNGIISFIKKYPCFFTIDSQGKVILDDREPAADMHYSGAMVDDHFEGEWSITIIDINEHGIRKEYDCTGIWFLYKEVL